MGTPADDLTLINRAAFYQDLAGPFGFGWVLHQKRPVRLLDVTRGAVLDHAADARLAAVDLLRTHVSTDDDVLVVGGEHGPATIRASVLFAGLAQHHSEEADRLAALLHNLSDVILIVDPTGIITYSSSSLDKVVGSQASRVGRNCFEFLHPDDEVTVRQLLNTAGQQPGDTIRGEARAFDPTGSEPSRVFELAVTDQRAKTGIDGIILTWRDISERRALEAELRHQALHDTLTGLANRTLFEDRINHALAHSDRLPSQLALIYLDLDGFKAINDRWGHPRGDDVLRTVGAALSAQSRSCDTVARLGGDEFGILLDGFLCRSEVEEFVARLHRALEAKPGVDDREIVAQASVGVVIVDAGDADAEGLDASELISRADAAMYSAKSEGKSCTVSWERGMREKALASQRLNADLRAGIDKGQLLLHLQPVVTISDGSIFGLEALVRWRHPSLGLVPPNEFIPVAESNGTIAAITRWVLRAACEQGGELAREHALSLVLSVNISAVELGRADLADDITEILAVTGFASTDLELEITETALVTDFSTARTSIETLKALGVRIAIDDFGTGYSSLSYLHELPVDRLKIDKTFIDRLGDRTGDGLVRGVIDLAHALNLVVTAEGIESAGQLDALTAMGCDQAQGFFFSEPTARPLTTTVSWRSPAPLRLRSGSRSDLELIDTQGGDRPPT